MPLSTQSQADDEQYVLVASLDNAQILSTNVNDMFLLFRLSTFGSSGNAHYDYSKDSDMMELFRCTKTQTNRYKMSLLKPSTKALALSCKVSVRTDSRGFLSLQYLVRNDDGQICFVEYYCCPDEEVD
uniref:RAD1 homolog (S. pombe) n=1 Tax=Amphiprion ocellaris TaxID=80972 RepID=A0A3Q1CF03_AMPOC